MRALYFKSSEACHLFNVFEEFRSQALNKPWTFELGEPR